MPAGSKNAPEARAREKIDRLLDEAGWTIQDRDEINVSLPAVTVREFKLETGHGFAASQPWSLLYSSRHRRGGALS
jgi:hypothetical protein